MRETTFHPQMENFETLGNHQLFREIVQTSLKHPHNLLEKFLGLDLELLLGRFLDYRQNPVGDMEVIVEQGV